MVKAMLIVVVVCVGEWGLSLTVSSRTSRES